MKRNAHILLIFALKNEWRFNLLSWICIVNYSPASGFSLKEVWRRKRLLLDFNAIFIGVVVTDNSSLPRSFLQPNIDVVVIIILSKSKPQNFSKQWTFFTGGLTLNTFLENSSYTTKKFSSMHFWRAFLIPRPKQLVFIETKRSSEFVTIPMIGEKNKSCSIDLRKFTPQ